MSRRLSITFCLLCLVLSSAAAARTTRTTATAPEAIPEPPTEKLLSAVLLLSDRPDEVLASWEDPDAAMPVHTADTIRRGEAIVAFIFFTACKQDARGFCNVSVDFMILNPDGAIYDHFEDRDLWIAKPAPPEGMMRLAAEYVGVVIEDVDPLGRYEFRVTLHDRNAGTSLELRRAFTATASP